MSGKRDWSKVGEIVLKTRELRLSTKEGAKRFGVKAGVLYEYSRRQKKAGKGGVKSQGVGGSRPEETAKGREKGVVRLPEEVQERIRAYRRQHPAHGFKPIADLLKQKYLVVVSRKQIRVV